MLLTDELLLNYKRCQRRAFLNVYGNPLERDTEKDFLLKLRKENQLHISQVLADKTYHKPQADRYDWQGRARETQELMQQGVECISQGVLLQSCSPDGIFQHDREQSSINWETVTLVGTPSLLVKQPGNSKFGDWSYYPINIKLGRRPKPEYKLIAAFHAQLLAMVQGTFPKASQLILRRQNTYLINLEYWISRMQQIITESVQMLLRRKEPEVFISRQRCSLCHWYSHCYAIAQSQNHLSLVPGVTPNRYEQLQILGLETVESLAAACPIDMGEVIGVEIASQLKQQAQSIIQNRPMLKLDYVLGRHSVIPSKSIELYFDIEAEPEINLDYLLGILLVDRQNKTEKFYPFLAEKPEEEQTIWEQFLALLSIYKEAPIFHFSEYEVETIKRLAKLYQTPRAQIKPILSRMIDLHKQVTTSVTLPVESYSLKSLANWLGFEWRDPNASGDQSVCWYDKWLKSGDRNLLELLLRYNEDDCRATLYLKDWLVDFLPKNP